jgi:hypothetical protein
MQRFNIFYSQDWYVILTSWQKELVRTTFELVAREERMQSHFDDYSFLVFPMAKAYEGFLKDFFYKTNLISKDIYMDKRFRIGKALNPDIRPDRRDDEWLYSKIAQLCGVELAKQLWQTWLEGRNQVFHYFPENERRLTLEQAIQIIELFAQTMDLATHCKINQQESK